MNLGLTGKRALVLGGSKGIGLGIARALRAEGAELCLAARGSDFLRKAALEIGGARTLTIDLFEAGSVGRAIPPLVREWDGVDILVVNTGGPPKGPFLEISEESWRRGFQGLWLATTDAIAAVLPGMQQRKWGRILLVTSVAAKEPMENLTVSNGLRAGLLGLAKSLSREVIADGVTVNAILPGYTDTETVAPYLGPDAVARIPAKRLATPSDQGSLAAFLASDLAGYITGQMIACDGGYLRGI